MAVGLTGRNAAKVLVVDDEADVRELVRVVLLREGFEVATRPATDLLLSRLPAIKPDVIILDVHMPMEDGGKFLRRLRCIEQFAGIRVLMMSGRPVTAEEWDSYRDLGAVEFVRKPFDINDLVGRVRRLLEPSAADA